MRDIKIYLIEDKAGDGAYICRGVLLDRMRKRGFPVKRLQGNAQFHVFKKGTVFTQETELPVKATILTCDEEQYSSIYDGSNPSFKVCKPVGKDVKWSIIDDTMDLDDNFEVRTLNTKMYNPVTLPQHVFLERDNRGHLVCRISTHPEYNGILDPGKMFFPDRNWKDVDEGEIVVESLTELPAYGFVRGYMVKYEMPDIKDFLEWAAENIDPDTCVSFIHNSIRGNYIGYYDRENGFYMRVIQNGDSFSTVSFPYMCSDFNRGNGVVLTLLSVILEHIYGKPMNADTFLKRFEHSQFSPVTGEYTRQLDTVFTSLESLDTLPPVMRKAIEYGIISDFAIDNGKICIFVLSVESLNSILYFSAEEIEELITLYNTSNKQADKDIVVRLRTDKLRLANI